MASRHLFLLLSSALACCVALAPQFQPPIAPTSIMELPKLPSGVSLQLSATGIIGATAGVGLGGKLWPCAAALCGWLRSEDGIEGASVLELGCGTGAVGLYSAGLGAAHVLLSDDGTPELLALTQRNVDANRPLYPACRVHTTRYKWGERLPQGHFSLILASDVTYARSSLAALADTCAMALNTDGPKPRIVLAHEHRTLFGVDTRLGHFLGCASERGLSVSTLRVVKQARYRLRDISILEVSQASNPAA